MKSVTYVIAAVLLVLVVMQLVPVDRTNPAVETEVPAPPEVRAIFKRACYDCHSNETVWPWYSRIAPVSWLVAWDVSEGREELNFSTWNRYNEVQRLKKIKETREEVNEGEMPPWFYVLLHPEAQVSDQDRASLGAWTDQVAPLQREEED